MSMIKLCSALSLVLIMLLSSCTELPIRDAPEQPERPVVSDKPENPASTKYHVVLSGESLKMIAAQYQRDYKDMVCWNNLKAPDYQISSGQRLLLDGPSCSHTVPEATSVPIVKPSTPTITKPEAKEGTHIVQEGEQLYAIARRYGKRFRDLAAWNNIKAPFHVKIGQVLLLTAPISISNPRPRNHNYHIVLPGDSLLTLAKNYDKSIAQLRAWNNLEPPYNLSIGQKLRITPPTGSTSSSRVTPVVPLPSTIIRPSQPSNNSSGFNPTSTSSRYVVKPGESFKSIADKYGIAVDELANWNGMGPPYTVYPGLKLKLEPPQ